LPFALALIGYSAATATGLLVVEFEDMLFWIAEGWTDSTVIILITSTFFALIIVTLPGMYPFRAIKAAGDLVVGRRLKILLRLIWMGVGVVLVWR